MSKTSATFLMGVVTSGLGVLLGLNAATLATSWLSLDGRGSWVGALDPHEMRVYQILGFALLGSGIVMSVMAIGHWLFFDRSGQKPTRLPRKFPISPSYGRSLERRMQANRRLM